MHASLMALHCHILFSLAITAIARAILTRTSAEQVPSLHRVAPRYLKLVTPLWLLAVHANICTDVVRGVGHDLALFFAPTSIPLAFALSTSLLVMS